MNGISFAYSPGSIWNGEPTIGLLLDVSKVLLGKLKEHRDGSRLDGDTTLLLIGTGVHSTRVTSLGGGDDTGLGEEGIGKGRLSVIDCGGKGRLE